MRIAIDYRSALSQRVGVGRYTKSLVRGLSRLDSENQYLLFSFLAKGYREKTAEFSSPAPNFRLLSAPIPTRLTRFWANRLSIPIENLIGESDVVHFPEPYPFRSRVGKTVVTVHDITFELMPEMFTRDITNLFRKQMNIVTRRADEIIAVSEQTRDDLVRIYGLDASRVHVVMHGVEESFRPVEDEERLKAVRNRYGLPDRFLLHVGTLEPRKNQRRLLEAFGLMCEKHKDDHNMVICGKKGWLYEDVFKTAESPPLRGRVIFTGYVSDDELPCIYSLATGVAYPSLYEGFGLPILEAMACGRPVLTSNRGAMAEVAGGAALLVNPEDVDEMATSLHRLLRDEDLRDGLTKAGLERAGQLTWEDTARGTLEVYKRSARNREDE